MDGIYEQDNAHDRMVEDIQTFDPDQLREGGRGTYIPILAQLGPPPSGQDIHPCNV